MITANDPANDVYEYEAEIIETRDDLFWELQTTGSLFHWYFVKMEILKY